MTLQDQDHRHRDTRRKNGRFLSKWVLAITGVMVFGAAGIEIASRIELPQGPHAAKLMEAPKSSHLTFDSKFTGDSLNKSVFGTCYPWADAATGCTNYGNPTDRELEWYLASQDQVSGGVLHLVARRKPAAGTSQNGKFEEFECRSGMVTTYPSFRFKYGYVQVVAKVPFGNGLWSAIWLAAANKKWPPEIDMLEHWASDAQGKVYLHPLSGARQGGPVDTPNLSEGYHTFTLDWTPTQLTWYYDGNQVLSTTTGVPQQSMYLVVNLADDRLGPGSCSGSMDIKSIKVWQQVRK